MLALILSSVHTIFENQGRLVSSFIRISKESDTIVFAMRTLVVVLLTSTCGHQMMIPYCGLSLFNALLLKPESRGSGPVKIHCFFLKKINRPTVIAPIVARTIAKPIEKSKKFCKSSPFIPYTLEMNVRGSKMAENIVSVFIVSLI